MGLMPQGTLRTVLAHGTKNECWSDQPFYVAEGVEDLYDLLVGTPGLHALHAWTEPATAVFRYHPDFATTGSITRSCTVPMITSEVTWSTLLAHGTIQSFGVHVRPEWGAFVTQETSREDTPAIQPPPSSPRAEPVAQASGISAGEDMEVEGSGGVTAPSIRQGMTSASEGCWTGHGEGYTRLQRLDPP